MGKKTKIFQQGEFMRSGTKAAGGCLSLEGVRVRVRGGMCAGRAAQGCVQALRPSGSKGDQLANNSFIVVGSEVNAKELGTRTKRNTVKVCYFSRKRRRKDLRSAHGL